MQVNKVVGCVGKTCALAKLNDSSGGKRSKRRSKEERKEMVETFVKRHQSSNNGNFPSLNLTHKEVGGSYYTVREIFRELIQENRVLAPPKLPPGDDQNMENLDSFLEDNPLGSISFDPNVHGLPPKDSQKLVIEYESRREKVLNSKWVSETHRQNLDNDDLINGSSHVTMKNEEFVEAKHVELLTGRVLDDETGVEPCEGQLGHLSEDVVVETFPLRPVSSMVYNVDDKTSEKELLDDDLDLETDNNSNAAVDTDKNIALSSKYLDSNDSSSSLQQSEMQSSGIIQKQTADATLNGINIDSCEETAASKKSVCQETNPILSFMKTLVSAFVKFWSE